MANTRKYINISTLMVNPENYRFSPVKDEKTAIKVMLDKHNSRIKQLLEDIATFGLNPSDILMVCKIENKYITLEGNRRLTALKILNDVSILKDIDIKYYNEYLKLLKSIKLPDNKLLNLSKIFCIVFDTPEEADRWVKLKHTGSNKGTGTIVWGTAEKRNFDNRTSSKKTNFISSLLLYLHNSPLYSDVIKQNLNNIPITNLERLLSDPYVREVIGINLEKNEIFKLYPDSEISKPLSKILLDLINKKINVKNIYTKDLRFEYTSTFLETDLPDINLKYKSQIKLYQSENEVNSKEEQLNLIDTNNDTDKNTENTQDITSSAMNNNPSEQSLQSFSENNNELSVTNVSNENSLFNEPTDENKPKTIKDNRDINRRKYLIPARVQIKINNPRINKIYKELKQLDIDKFTNSVAVLFRVFIEVSMDEYIEVNKLTTVNNDSKLSKKVSACLEDLKKKNLIKKDFIKPINISISNQDNLISINTFNSYVHNKHMYPDPTQLKNSWNQFEGFIISILNNC